MTDKSLVRSVLDWLRAGYPGGVPGPDRVPLLAVLRDTPLTEEQVKEVVREIASHQDEVLADGVIDHDEIEKFIEGVAHHDGGPENIKRVADVLAAAGWTLAPSLDAADEKLAED
jgi:hypothetical protein